MGTTTELAGEVMRRGTDAARLEHAALFERIIGRIHGFFQRSAWDEATALDLLQETLLQIERSLRDGKYDPDRSFNTWMWLKAHTAYAAWCRGRERERARRAKLEAQATDPASVDPAEETAERLDARTVLQSLQRDLGDETYEVFCLYYQGGLSQAEIAEALDRDRKTVRKRLRKAHEHIERLLGHSTAD
ncbi:RNA polymerase sigma factor [Planctomycetota bacterium]